MVVLLNDRLVESADNNDNSGGHLEQRNLAMSHSGGHMRALLVDHQKVLVIVIIIVIVLIIVNFIFIAVVIIR